MLVPLSPAQIVVEGASEEDAVAVHSVVTRYAGALPSLLQMFERAAAGHGLVVGRDGRSWVVWHASGMVAIWHRGHAGAVVRLRRAQCASR